MSSLILRPGVLTGPYPERNVPPPGRLEELLGSVAGVGLRLLSPSLPRIVARVEAQGRGLEHLSDRQLLETARALRPSLGLDGLGEGRVARAFALTREAARRTLGLSHYPVQLMGGWAILQGMVAEMDTGEGKTLTATLAAVAAALAGIPVHVITVNDYLARRDAVALEPLYRALGLSVGCIVEGLDPSARRQAYARDIVYATNKQLAFDYLRDRLTLGDRGRLRLTLERLEGNAALDRVLMRGLCFAIVDEADSVLVDEARTPLILSREGEDTGLRQTCQQALELARELERGRHYTQDGRERQIKLTPQGRTRLLDAAQGLGGLWRGTRRREELIRQALSALHLFVRDRHYLLREGKVQIIDEFTGRVMPDRSWERGLHQMIESKEGCELTGQKETLARLSYQQFFRRYLRLGGMTGTAREIAPELWSVYRLRVARVPTHRPCRRTLLPDRVYRREGQKWTAIVERVARLHARGRPVLVGTRSVAASEQLSLLLEQAGLPHRVLNARQDEEEAEIIAQAGEVGRITVATNMAGRGTDIRLGKGVVERGGLHVIASERHESRRIDRQLAGRCARQGDPGSFEAILSLEDELAALYCPLWLRALAALGRGQQRPLAFWTGPVVFARVQRAAQRQHARTRRQLLRLDRHLGDLLAFSGRGE
ncbi:MAG: preprotein translocase subunit SecA [Candidatus Competibacteraceae bacterium]|nr:preprotein translocase subunit SecA [Candidatus Competibacteraceae bacterium]